MKFEHINNDAIHIFLSKQDLEDRGMSVMNLLGDKSEMEHFFFDLLKEIDDNGDFKHNDSVAFQIIPNKEGLELLVTKNGVDLELLNKFTNISNKVNDFKDTDSNTTKIVNYNNSSLKQLFKVDNLHDIKLLEESLLDNSNYYDDSLFLYNGNYYLLFKFKNMSSLNKCIPIVEEFLNKVDLSVDIIEEHGKNILNSDVLTELNKLYE